MGSLPTRHGSHRKLTTTLLKEDSFGIPFSIEDKIATLVQELANRGFVLTPVRVLEMLLWTQYEERGYYFAA